MKGNYKAVSFDLWFTLIYEDDKMLEDVWRGRVTTIYNIVKTYRDDVSFEDVYRMYYEMRHILMTTHPKKIIEYIVVGLGIEEEAIDKIYSRYVETSTLFKPHVNKEAYEVLPRLKEMGVKIGLTTNTSYTKDMIWKLLGEIGLSEYIDVIVSSSELGFVKPDIRIFRETLKQLKVEPHEALHVGDKYIYDAIGSYLAGMKPILYKGLWPMYQYYKDFSQDVTEFAYPPNIKVISSLEEIIDYFK